MNAHLRMTLSWLAASLLIAGCASVQRPADTPRRPATAPSSALAAAVAEFKARDPDASFSFVDGHVDSFATAAKAQVPDYALPVLAALGLPTTAEPVRRFLAPVRSPKPARDLDAGTAALPFVTEAGGAALPSAGRVDEPDVRRGESAPRLDERRQPAVDADQLVEWRRPDTELQARERRAALGVLRAFLDRHGPLFEVDARELEGAFSKAGFQTSPQFRKLVIEQQLGGEKVLYGRTLVHFDRNWNLVGISRMLMTPQKLALQATPTDGIGSETAARTALAAPPLRECGNKPAHTLRAERAIDTVRRVRVFDIESASADGDCHWRSIVDAATGRLLNTTDLIDRAFTDASVNRWAYPGGNLFAPQQFVSSGQYTRNDRRLEHDFFYMMNDHRCEGAAETSCGETSFTSTWCSKAYGSTSGDSFIRATRRSDRNFSSYFPGGASETFGETHAYYWGRQFAQWLKPSLDAMGVLPDSAADFPRVLIISDACRAGSVHNASFAVTTDDNKGEGTNVIRLAHRNPGAGSNHNASCEAGGCFDNPSNLHHEMNHFFLRRYYDVGSDLDCNGGNQLKFIHEGALGTAVPQAFWHSYYGVGYAPNSTNKLYFSHTDVGRVHTNNGNLMTIGGRLCVDNTDDPYSAGRVVGQALWKFYHGIQVSGSTQSGTWRPSTDTDFNWIVYWAADLAAASTYKDRYEYANRLMEILDKHTNWSAGGKADYCAIFQQHGLRDFIADEYCS